MCKNSSSTCSFKNNFIVLAWRPQTTTCCSNKCYGSLGPIDKLVVYIFLFILCTSFKSVKLGKKPSLCLWCCSGLQYTVKCSCPCYCEGVNHFTYGGPGSFYVNHLIDRWVILSLFFIQVFLPGSHGFPPSDANMEVRNSIAPPLDCVPVILWEWRFAAIFHQPPDKKWSECRGWMV